MVSELSPEVRAKLEGLGHKIPDDAGVLPLNLRGVTSQQVAILEEHFLRVGPEKKGKRQEHLVCCLNCSWSSKSSGLYRALEHVLHRSNPNKEDVTKFLQSKGLAFTEQKASELEKYRGNGNRVLCCTKPVEYTQELYATLAGQGNSAAKLWNKLLKADPALDDLVNAVTDDGVEPRKPEDLQRLHALSIIHQHAPFNSIENPVCKMFLKAVAPDYKPPDRKRVREVLHACSEELQTTLVQKLRADGPWVISADGATVDSCGFFNIRASNLQGTCLHLAHCQTTEMDCTAEALSDLLRPWVEISSIASICGDNAKNMVACARRLAEQSPHPLLALRCHEHGAQLLLKDIREAMPYVKNATTEIHAAIKWLRKQKKLIGKVRAACLTFIASFSLHITLGTSVDCIEHVRLTWHLV